MWHLFLFGYHTKVHSLMYGDPERVCIVPFKSAVCLFILLLMAKMMMKTRIHSVSSSTATPAAIPTVNPVELVDLGGVLAARTRAL